jgi:protein disulfide-isomerase A1
MKMYLILVVILFFSSSATANNLPVEEGVLVLNDQNFEEALKLHDNLLVEFYAPWCGHCQELAPHYSKAALTLRGDSPPLYLAKVDATVATLVAKKYEVEGFPTMKFFSKGEPSEYEGGRTEDEIVGWMRRKTGPPSKVLTTVNDVTTFTTNAEVAVVFFGVSATLNEYFVHLANSYDDTQFGECASQECLTHFNVSNGNVVVFRKFDPTNTELKTVYTADELKSFVDGSSSKLIASFDEKTAQLVFGKQVPGLFFYRTKGSEAEKTFDELAASVADELKGKIQIVVTDIQDGLEQRLAEYIGVTNAELPTVRIHDTREDLRKFNLEGPLTKENVLNFVKDWLNGKLVPKVKSEDESVTTQGSGPVMALVGTNFNTIVYDNTKDVLVEFYAPWCGHCQKLSPIYEDLATRLKETNPNILIAKVDSTANDLEGLDIQGFPTIKFFKIGDKTNPVDFEGERDLSGMTDFLAANVKDFKRPEGIPASVPKAPEAENEDGENDQSENDPVGKEGNTGANAGAGGAEGKSDEL